MRICSAFSSANKPFRHVTRISSRRGQPGAGLIYPLPKTENSSDLSHYILGPGQFILFSYFTIKFHFNFPLRGGGYGPLAPPPLATSLKPFEAITLIERCEKLSVYLCTQQTAPNKCEIDIKDIEMELSDSQRAG